MTTNPAHTGPAECPPPPRPHIGLTQFLRKFTASPCAFHLGFGLTVLGVFRRTQTCSGSQVRFLTEPLKMPGNCLSGLAFTMHDKVNYRAHQSTLGGPLETCFPGNARPAGRWPRTHPGGLREDLRRSGHGRRRTATPRTKEGHLTASYREGALPICEPMQFRRAERAGANFRRQRRIGRVQGQHGKVHKPFGEADCRDVYICDECFWAIQQEAYGGVDPWFEGWKAYVRDPDCRRCQDGAKGPGRT